MTRTAERDRVWALTPGGRPDPGVVLAAGRAGALGCLDLGLDPDLARAALAETATRSTVRFGIRVPAGLALTAADLLAPAATDLADLAGLAASPSSASSESSESSSGLLDLVDTVVVCDPSAVADWAGEGRRIVVEVASADALAGIDGPAVAAVTGLLVHDLDLLAVVLDALGEGATLPVWVRGGLGVHTAAGAVVAGAAGVVLDGQLALLRESALPAGVRRAVARGEDEGLGAQAALAASFARRWRTVGRTVTGVRAAIEEHVSDAVRFEPLVPAGQGRRPLVVVSEVGDAVPAPTSLADATALRRQGALHVVLAEGLGAGAVVTAEQQIDALAALGRLDDVEVLVPGVHDERNAALVAAAIAPLAAAGARIGFVVGDRSAWGDDVPAGASADEILAAVSNLNDRVTLGATAWLLGAAESIGVTVAAPEARPVDIAIVGLGAVLPGAPDVETFWANIVDAVDSVTEVSPDRWDPAIHFDPDFDAATISKVPNPKTASKWGGWVPDVEFDALAWGIPPASLAAIDPVQILALEAAADALADAGYADGGFDRDRASVIYASGSGGGTDLPVGYALRSFLPNHFGGVLPPELDAFLPRLTEDGFPGILTSVIAGRVANRLDLGGKNLTVDAACASTVAALDIACNELVAGTSDLVLCGGADLHNALHDFFYFTAVQALSPRGRCASFDADADGMTLGEGVGCIVLKRLEDAERDGDRIYAVVKGVAGSSDGRHLGLTAPRQQGQEKSLRRAYAQAGISPADVGLIEAHGTGTVAGDRTELGTLTEVFGEAGAAPGSVVLGSVKSNIGHIKCAAGIAGLIKAAKAIYHGVLPPTLHLERPNDAWDAASSPFTFVRESRPWLDERRVAGVSAFGFGGTNFHAVLESHGDPMPETGRERWPVELFAFRATDDVDVDNALDELLERLDAERNRPVAVERFRPRDIAAAVAEAGDGPVRLALVAGSLDELHARAEAARARRASPGVHWRTASAIVGDSGAGDRPKVAFVVPGEQSGRPGMLADLLVTFPAARDAARRGRKWADLMLTSAPFGDLAARSQRAALARPGVAEAALAVAGLTVSDVLAGFGIVPDAITGEGAGELVARCIAGALDRDVLWGDASAMAVPSGDIVPVYSGSDGGVSAQIEALYRDGVRVFVEAGPAGGTVDLVGRVLGNRPHLAVAADSRDDHGVVAIVNVLAQLAVSGVPVDLDALFAQRDAESTRWTEPARPAGWVVNGHLVRVAATGDTLPGGMHSSTEAPQIERGELVPLTVAAATPASPIGASPPAASEDLVLLEYLRTTNGLILTAADILRNALGLDLPIPQMPTALAGPAPAAAAPPAATRSASAPTSAPVGPSATVTPIRPASPTPASAPVAPSAPTAGAQQAQDLLRDPEALLERLVDLVSERTGYPPDMLDPDLDVEADLSIDSIKRIEILGELADGIGLGQDGALDHLESLVEELAARKTLRSIVAWLIERGDLLSGPTTAAGAPAAASNQ